jgi:hypothetical protein
MGGAVDAGGSFATRIENIALFFRGLLTDGGLFKAAMNAFVAEEGFLRTLEPNRFYQPSKRLVPTSVSGRPYLG